MASQRDADTDVWKETWGVSPTGVALRMFWEPDKSSKRIKTETLSRKFAFILDERLMVCDVFARKAEGVISIDWVPMVRIDVESLTEVTVKWNRAFTDKYPDFDKNGCLAAFNARAAGAGIEWV